MRVPKPGERAGMAGAKRKQLAGAIISAKFTPTVRFKAGCRRIGKRVSTPTAGMVAMDLDNFVWRGKTNHGQRCCIAINFCHAMRKESLMRLIAENIASERGGNELFSGISFVIGKGEGLILTGPNGAGKSTLLRILAGLLRAHEGTCRLTGDDGLDAVDAIHILTTQNAMKDALTVRENLGFWRGFLPDHDSGTGVSPETALEAVRLLHVMDLPFGYLSTGQRRRVAIARLLVSHRPLWVVDEPTSGLDKASEALFADMAKAHLTSGGLLVAATHLPLGINGLQHLTIGGEA